MFFRIFVFFCLFLFVLSSYKFNNPESVNASGIITIRMVGTYYDFTIFSLCVNQFSTALWTKDFFSIKDKAAGFTVNILSIVIYFFITFRTFKSHGFHNISFYIFFKKFKRNIIRSLKSYNMHRWTDEPQGIHQNPPF